MQNSKFKIITETLKYAAGLSKIWDKDTPAQLIFFVTNRCNSRCNHCFYWQSLNKKVEGELSLEEIEKISCSMGRIFWLFISGGEPFLRDDLPQICQVFYKNNQPKSIIIPTNGLLRERIIEMVSKIAQDCPGAKIILQLSIDEIGERHDTIRGVKGNFARLEKLIPQLKKLQGEYPNLALQANTVFCRENQDRIGKIYDYIYHHFGLDNICLSLVRGQPRVTGTKEVDLKKYWQAQLHLRQTRRFSHYTSLLSYLITKKEEMQVEMFLKSFQTKKAVVPCLAARQTVVLSPNGDLAVCELRKERYGNLRKVNYNFARLWRSPKVRQLRQKVKGCWCTQECVYTPNVFLNPRVWPMFLKYLTLGKI